MRSLVLLMIETEQPESLSARKLVVETAKHNVITAYDAEEGMSLLERFPRVDAIMIHGGLLQKTPDLVRRVKVLAPRVPIILASPFEDSFSEGADFVVNSHQPHAILKVLAVDLQADISN